MARAVPIATPVMVLRNPEFHQQMRNFQEGREEAKPRLGFLAVAVTDLGPSGVPTHWASC